MRETRSIVETLDGGGGGGGAVGIGAQGQEQQAKNLLLRMEFADAIDKILGEKSDFLLTPEIRPRGLDTLILYPPVPFVTLLSLIQACCQEPHLACCTAGAVDGLPASILASSKENGLGALTPAIFKHGLCFLLRGSAVSTAKAEMEFKKLPRSSAVPYSEYDAEFALYCTEQAITLQEEQEMVFDYLWRAANFGLHDHRLLDDLDVLFLFVFLLDTVERQKTITTGQHLFLLVWTALACRTQMQGVELLRSDKIRKELAGRVQSLLARPAGNIKQFRKVTQHKMSAIFYTQPKPQEEKKEKKEQKKEQKQDQKKEKKGNQENQEKKKPAKETQQREKVVKKEKKGKIKAKKEKIDHDDIDPVALAAALDFQVPPMAKTTSPVPTATKWIEERKFIPCPADCFQQLLDKCLGKSDLFLDPFNKKLAIKPRSQIPVAEHALATRPRNQRLFSVNRKNPLRLADIKRALATEPGDQEDPEMQLTSERLMRILEEEAGLHPHFRFKQLHIQIEAAQLQNKHIDELLGEKNQRLAEVELELKAIKDEEDATDTESDSGSDSEAEKDDDVDVDMSAELRPAPMIHSASAPTYIRGPIPPEGGKGFILSPRVASVIAPATTPTNKVQELQHALQELAKKHAVEMDHLKEEHKHQMRQQIEGYDSLNQLLAQKNQTIHDQTATLTRQRAQITELERKLSQAEHNKSKQVTYNNPILAQKRKLSSASASSAFSSAPDPSRQRTVY